MYENDITLQYVANLNIFSISCHVTTTILSELYLNFILKLNKILKWKEKEAQFSCCSIQTNFLLYV